MALYTDTPKDTPVKQNSTESIEKDPRIRQQQFESSTVDSRYNPRNSLLINIEGSAWYATYYSQVLGNDDEVAPLDLDRDPVYQQYQKINQLELRVVSPLDQSQSPDTNSFEVTGTARLYPKVIPNKGDMFLADIGDGQLGVFAVTSSRRLTIYRDSIHEIEYRLVDQANQQYVDNLELKTVDSTIFVKERLSNGEEPFIDIETYNRYQKFGEHYSDLLNYHHRLFFSRNIQSYQVPSQAYPTYDPFLVKTIKTLGLLNELPRAGKAKLYTTKLPNRIPPYTFWDAFIELSSEKLGYLDQKLALVDSAFFGTDPRLDSLMFSGIDRVVYPISSDFVGWPSSEYIRAGRSLYHPRYSYNIEASAERRPEAKTIDTNDGDSQSRPDIHLVTTDDFYVFSAAFYGNIPKDQSRLERLVRCAMDLGTVDSKTLLSLCEASRTWSRLEQFYYIPVLLILLKCAINQG